MAECLCFNRITISSNYENFSYKAWWLKQVFIVVVIIILRNPCSRSSNLHVFVFNKCFISCFLTIPPFFHPFSHHIQQLSLSWNSLWFTTLNKCFVTVFEDCCFYFSPERGFLCLKIFLWFFSSLFLSPKGITCPYNPCFS